MPPRDLRRLLSPQSIAVVGASDQPGNLGGRVIGYLRKFGFPGEVWPVNPRRDTVAGEKCYAAVDHLPAVPDLALIAVGAPLVLDAVRDCIEAGIRNGIVLAGGFAELDAEGARRQAELIALCARSGFNLCGPNTVGIIDAWAPMTASFASHLIDLPQLRKGTISLVSQSGGTAAVVHALAERAGFGLRYLISAGNEAVLSVADYLRALAHDPHTEVIGMYLEGTRDGADFIDALAEVRAAGKAVVILKAGVAEVSARAAAAHTGSLAGEAKVWSALFDEYGVVPVHSLLELLDTALALAHGASLPQPGPVGILGLGDFATGVAENLCRQAGLPVGRVAVVDAAARLAPALAEMRGHGAVLLEASMWQGGDTDAATLAEAMIGFGQSGGAPLFAALPAGFAAHDRLAAAGLPGYAETGRAVSTLRRLSGRTVPYVPQEPAVPHDRQYPWHELAPPEAMSGVVTEYECHRFLARAGLPVAMGELVTTAQQAADAGIRVGFPVAMKAISAEVTHRAAAGLLALGVADAADAGRSFDRIKARADAAGVTLDAVYLQHMEEGEVEIIVSALRDPVFGVVVTCGAGGTATELLDDVVIARAPVTPEAAAAMLERLRYTAVARRLDPGLTLEPMAAFIAAFSQLAASAPWASFALEVNPVKWSADKAVAVDGLLVIG